MSVKIVDRLNILREGVDRLTKTERSRLRKRVRELGVEAGHRMINRIRAITPESMTPESSEVMAYREAAWKFYGVQPYLQNTSAIPTIRKHGITANQGWNEPRVDFRGSQRSLVNASITLSNDSGQASLLYNFIESYGPIEPVYRKKLMFQGVDGRPVVRQRLPNSGIFPARRGINIDNIIEVEAEDFRRKIDLQRLIEDEFRDE